MTDTTSIKSFTTPMMIQYMDIKKQYPDALLFFRLGDFYELFLEDAIIGAKVLGITLTARPRGKDGDIPMAGVPYHSASAYIAKLVSAGYKIAICEQTSPPDKKGIVDREVVRIITPGTLTDEISLNVNENNFALSLHTNLTTIGICLIELSTGEVILDEIPFDESTEQMSSIMARFSPAEVIISKKIDSKISEIFEIYKTNVYPQDDWFRMIKNAAKKVSSQFQLSSLKHLGIDEKYMSVKACAALLNYLETTQKQTLTHLKELRLLSQVESVILDASTIKNLELFETIRDKSVEGSLIHVLDRTSTPMGARLLRNWLKHPLRDYKSIKERQNTIVELIKNSLILEELSDNLTKVSDLERMLSRLHLNQTNPKEVLRIADGLDQIFICQKILEKLNSDLIKIQSETINFDLKNLSQLIRETLKETVPVDPKKGNFIQPGQHQDLDALRQIITESKQWIVNLEETERKRSGINSLKIKFNQVFGYYIEISKANLSQVPSDYERKQTLVNAERFITPDLKKHEDIILSHQVKTLELELEIFQNLIEKISIYTQQIQKISQAIAVVDCLSSLAKVAIKNNYVKPAIDQNGKIQIENGRHPVVEQLLPGKSFVENDVLLDQKKHQLILITGPNMAGKSVYMRQVALITLMALIGSFVPATKAEVCLVDRIFVRSGAADVITQGLSTFMVEMTETAYILKKATKDSLIIMDEIGRGTSTFDGISIAWAVAEYIVKNLESKTLFATHYHELQELETQFPLKIRNFHAAVELHLDEPVFIHRILKGPAAHSFGIAVAKLAGVPNTVTELSQKILKTLENTTNVVNPKFRDTNQLDLFEPFEKKPEPNKYENIINKINQIQIGKTTPLEALNLLSDLQNQLSQTEL